MTTEPTDREHEMAADLIDRMEPMGPAMRYRTLALAFAEQRAKYEAVADELDPVEVALSGVAYVAERIRNVTR